MDRELITDLRAQVAILWQRTRLRAGRLPVTARVVLGLFLVAAALMAFRTAFVATDATLRLKVQHGLHSAQLSVWVDGELAYSGKLVGTVRRKFGIIPDLQGSVSEMLPVSSGMHQVRIRISSDDGSAQEDTIKGEFARNSQRTLAVTARRGDLSLNWQGPSVSDAEPNPSTSGWFSRYAGSLMMTVAGSIISALVGYTIRELPKHIATRRGGVPEA
jgi:hypothetical protein